jgi:predicted kinase
MGAAIPPGLRPRPSVIVRREREQILLASVAPRRFTDQVFYIFSGLPGSGKTTLAQRLAARVGAVYLRIDTIEQGLRDLCHVKVEGEGYRLTYRVATDNLRLGNSVIADSCNPIELTRREWEQLAIDVGVAYANIEVICSDSIEHRRRIETRASTVAGLQLPTWQNVVDREYHPWTVPRVIIDTAGCSEAESLDALLARLPAAPPRSAG